MLDADKRGQTRIDTSRNNAFKIAMISLARSEQYLKQPVAIKLFQLACNLKRIAYVANSDSALAARMQVNELAEQARTRSDEVLAMSGLLEQE